MNEQTENQEDLSLKMGKPMTDQELAQGIGGGDVSPVNEEHGQGSGLNFLDKIKNAFTPKKRA